MSTDQAMPNRFDWKTSGDRQDLVHRAVQSLVEGNLVVFPTETVYGLAAFAHSPSAVDRLVEFKGRSETKPFTLAIATSNDAHRYVPRMSVLGRRLVQRCWPGPVTMVFPPSAEPGGADLPKSVHSLVMRPTGIGLRVPDHPAISETLRLLQGPLLLTSANRSGGPAPIDADRAIEALGGDPQSSFVDIVIDDGPARFGQPSTVLRIGEDGLELIREGVVNLSRLQALAGEIVVFVCTGNTCRSPMAAAIFERMLAEELQCRIEELPQRGYQILSAGLAAFSGAAASSYAREVVREYGASLDDHISQPFDENLARISDRLIVMTRNHKDTILSAWPEEVGPKLSLLRGDRNVNDPLGGTIELYRECAQQIAESLRELMTQMMSASTSKSS